MKVVEIFKSIEGEGKRTGLPTTFIRLFGCNLRCSYCDTPYGYEGNDYKEMTTAEIVKKVQKLGMRSVTLTGGEPLIHKDIEYLVCFLLDEGLWVNIETNGSIDISAFKEKIRLLRPSHPDFMSNLFFTCDYKCESSGMESKMLKDNFKNLTHRDVLKFVVSNKKEIQKIESIAINTKAQIFVSPVFGDIEPVEIADYIIENVPWAKVQVQLHKII